VGGTRPRDSSAVKTYFRKKDFAHARRDLEEFVKVGGTGFEVEQAKALLAEMKR
jgi:hypothetical protein